MKRLITIFGLTTLLLGNTSSANSLLSYWNMDSSTLSGKLAANQGAQAGSISSSFISIGAGFESGIDPTVAGTTDNMLPPAPSTNRSVGFYRVGTIYDSGAFIMEDFDLSGLTDETIEFSFAFKAGTTFTWDENLEVDYRFGSGETWVDFAEEQPVPSTGVWNIAAIDFGTILNGQSNVDFRIRTVNWGSISGYLDIDNVQVNAVPEPGTWAAIIGVGVLGFAFWRRRKA